MVEEMFRVEFQFLRASEYWRNGTGFNNGDDLPYETQVMLASTLCEQKSS